MAQTIAIVGDCGVGKTALCRALRNGLLTKNEGEDNYQRCLDVPTVGVQASVATCLGPGVLLWDCSGCASSESLRIAHVKRASALIAVFDVSRYHLTLPLSHHLPPFPLTTPSTLLPSRPSTFESALTLIHTSKQSRPLDKLGRTKFPVALVALCHLQGSTAGVNMVSEEQQKERADRLNVNITARISLAFSICDSASELKRFDSNNSFMRAAKTPRLGTGRRNLSSPKADLDRHAPMRGAVEF